MPSRSSTFSCSPSCGIYPPGGLYYKLFGGNYGGHPEPYKFTVRVENKTIPLRRVSKTSPFSTSSIR
ncbi:MAG TPA: hypothetical protein VFO27_13415 [Bryobacteraceae bacterium]|nr:hypothetical protein [Bryobacteraceae bacterium]